MISILSDNCRLVKADIASNKLAPDQLTDILLVYKHTYGRIDIFPKIIMTFFKRLTRVIM